jgi:excinuclease ABC subunit A
VVVEHDEDTIRRADHMIDIGPGAGKRGGRLVAEGTVADLSAQPIRSPAACWRTRCAPAAAAARGGRAGPALYLRGASLHNLQQLDLRVPLQRLVAVTGVRARARARWRATCCWPTCRRWWA